MYRRTQRAPWIIGLTVVAVSVTSTAAGSHFQQALPSAADLVARHVEAVGGRDAILGHRSSRATGSLEVIGQGLSGEMTVYASAPDKTLIVVNFAAMGLETKTGYDGTVGWSTDPMTGPRLLQGGELQQLVDESVFYSDLHEVTRFQTMETVEQTQFAGRSAFKVRLVYNSGRESFEYFATDSGLLIGTEGVQESLMGSVNVVTVIEDYQPVGDLMVPRQIVQEIGPGQSVAVTIESVELDAVDPGVYELPASIKALIGG